MSWLLEIISRVWNQLTSVNLLPGLNIGYLIVFGIVLTLGGYLFKRVIL